MGILEQTSEFLSSTKPEDVKKNEGMLVLGSAQDMQVSALMGSLLNAAQGVMKSMIADARIEDALNIGFLHFMMLNPKQKAKVKKMLEICEIANQMDGISLITDANARNIAAESELLKRAETDPDDWKQQKIYDDITAKLRKAMHTHGDVREEDVKRDCDPKDDYTHFNQV